MTFCRSFINESNQRRIIMKVFLIHLYVLMTLLLFPEISFSKDVVTVQGGDFQMGCSIADKSCANDEGGKGGMRVHVPQFYIDKLEVSVEQYMKCMKDGNCTRPKDHNRNKYCNLGAKGRADHPVNCVDWDQASAYCVWVKGRLPYEAEWEKAARGGSQSRYPWGQEVSCKQAILDDGKTQGSVSGEPDGCGEDRTWKRASRPANAFGLFDMSGNAGEWTANWYSSDAIQTHYSKGNLKGPSKSRERVVRGGSWDENKANLRSSYRNVKLPISGDSVYGSIGFRCVYDNK